MSANDNIWALIWLQMYCANDKIFIMRLRSGLGVTLVLIYEMKGVLILAKTKDNDSAQAQFSIYKLSDAEIRKTCVIQHEINEKEYSEEVIKLLTDKITSELNDRFGSEYCLVKYRGFSGLIFKTIHHPLWCDLAKDIIEHNEYDDEQKEVGKRFIENANVSYVLFYPCNQSVYAITGGFGSHRIRAYVEKNFGLYLLPKLITDDYPAVKALIQNDLLGNHAATQRTNKNSTSIFMENSTNSVFRQINAVADREIAGKLGIEFDENEPSTKKLNMINKDSLVICRSLSIESLKKLIKTVNKLESSKDKFVLNYLVQARKKGIKSAKLLDELITTLKDGKIGQFLITGNDYTAYYTEADEYVLTNNKGKELIRRAEPIEFSDVIGLIPEDKRSNAAIKDMLKSWTIMALKDDGGLVLQQTKLMDALQGFVECGENKDPYILFNGSWYVFEEKYAKRLTEEYRKIYELNLPIAENLIDRFGLQKKDAANESAYNVEMKKNKSILVSHTALINNVEIADAIFWDEQAVYLMHNKDKFSGIGTRDVVNQVLTSAEYLHMALASTGTEPFLRQYYNSISGLYKKGNILVSEEQFISTMRSGKVITYVIGYMHGLNKNSRSTYAKYLTVDVTRKLNAMGYDCIFVGLT